MTLMPSLPADLRARVGGGGAPLSISARIPQQPAQSKALPTVTHELFASLTPAPPRERRKTGRGVREHRFRLRALPLCPEPAALRRWRGGRGVRAKLRYDLETPMPHRSLVALLLALVASLAGLVR